MNQYGKEILNALGLEQEEVVTSYNGVIALKRPHEASPFAKVIVTPERVRAVFGELDTDAPVRVVY